MQYYIQLYAMLYTFILQDMKYCFSWGSLQYKNRIIICTSIRNSHLTVNVTPPVSIMTPKCISKQKVMCVIYPVILIISLTNLTEKIIFQHSLNLQLWKQYLTFLLQFHCELSIFQGLSWVILILKNISNHVFAIVTMWQKYLSRQFCTTIIKNLANTILRVFLNAMHFNSIVNNKNRK